MAGPTIAHMTLENMVFSFKDWHLPELKLVFCSLITDSCWNANTHIECQICVRRSRGARCVYTAQTSGFIL